MTFVWDFLVSCYSGYLHEILLLIHSFGSLSGSVLNVGLTFFDFLFIFISSVFFS